MFNRVKNSRTINGLSSALRYRGREYKRRAAKVKPVRMLRRAATAAIGGVAAGTLGLAAGITSGDLSKTLQYTTTGGLLGGKFGLGLGDKVADTVRVDGSEQAFNRGYYTPEQMDEMRKKKAIKEKEMDEHHWKVMAEQGFTQKEIGEINRNFLPECYDKGITDSADIAAAYKLMNKRITVNGDSEDEAKKKALATAGLVGKYGNGYRNSAKKEKDLRDSLSRNEFKNIPNGAGKDRLINTTKDLMDEFLDQKDNKDPFSQIRYQPPTP